MTSTPSDSQVSLYIKAAADPKQVKQCVEQLQQEGFLKWIQSKCILIVVGLDKREISVHEDLFIRYSPVFTQMCRPPFQESQRRIIQLPEDDFLTFGQFLSWIYKATPHLDSGTQGSRLLKLGIFAEKYQVPALVEQICDHMLSRLRQGGDGWLAPSDLKAVFEGTSTDSSLRQICCLYLHENIKITSNRISLKWHRLFEEVPELGWQYFELDKALVRFHSKYVGGDFLRMSTTGHSTYYRYRHLLPIADVDGALKKLFNIDPNFFEKNAWDHLNGLKNEDEWVSACSSAHGEEEKPASNQLQVGPSRNEKSSRNKANGEKEAQSQVRHSR